jgi:opacity protein-like surface antigen
MKKTLGFLSLVAATALAAPAHAQLPNVTPLSFEVRGGLAFPTGDFGEDSGDETGDIKSGTTLGANVTFHFMPLIGIYGGYTYNSFDVEGEDDASVIDQGFNAGVRVAIPTPLIPIDPYVKAGLVYNQLELEGSEGGVTFGIESDRSLGFEVGAGVGIGLGPKLSFTPQVTYTRYEPKFDGEGLDINVEHIRVDVGLRLRL